MVRIFDADYSLGEYRAHLGRLFGLFEPLERAVTRTAAASGVTLPPGRSSALREDLSAMGHSGAEIAALERCPRLPEIAPAGLPGYSYVMLGSMLGGQVIVKHLRTVLGPGASLLFYGGADGFGTLWSTFRRDLEERGRDDLSEICETAVQIFDAYSSWLAEPARDRQYP